MPATPPAPSNIEQLAQLLPQDSLALALVDLFRSRDRNDAQAAAAKLLEARREEALSKIRDA